MDDLITSDPIEPTQDTNLVTSVSPSRSPLPDAEFQQYIEQYPFAAEPTYFTRPNRYYGPASTWRSWTANDRAVAEAIDDSDAKDLSIHLYNAFALKQRAGHVAGARKVRSKSRSRNRAESAENTSFVPPETWTAWPLRGSQVPRRAAHESVKHGDTLRPSSALEEALTAITVRHAKQRWEETATAAPEVRVKSEKRDWHIGYNDNEKKSSVNQAMNDDDRSTADDADTISSSDDDDALTQGIQTFSSQAFLADGSSSESEDSPSDDEDNVPVFSADDDQARRILGPSTRHILSQLDDLLTGLHKARKAYSTKKPSSRSRSRSKAPEPDDTDVERTTQIRGRKRMLPAASESSPASHSQSRSRGRSMNRQYGVKGKSLGLRDWSDVLGMAALTGFNPATIARASERCARLFNQNMMFRTFHEPDAPNIQPHFEEEYALGSEREYTPPPGMRTAASTPDRAVHSRARSEISAYIPVRSEPLGNRVLSCPVQSCKQHEFVYTRSTRLYEHIRTVHPEFDLEAFKKVMARGGKRGRYDRSALRSRSRSRAKQRRIDYESREDDESDGVNDSDSV